MKTKIHSCISYFENVNVLILYIRDAVILLQRLSEEGLKSNFHSNS